MSSALRLYRRLTTRYPVRPGLSATTAFPLGEEFGEPRRLGFREVGVYEKHAQLDGVWRDVVIVERLLTA